MSELRPVTPELEQAQASLDQLRGITQSPQNALTTRLRLRRISQDTASLFDVKPYKLGNQWGWSYPTPGGGLRWKNADSHAEPKYAWIPGQVEGDDYYWPPGMLEAIADAGGIVWMATEADVWALREAGIRNAFAAYTESPPEGLGDTLITAGVLRVLIAPDLDQTGRNFAVKVKGGLAGSTIELTAYQLPASLGEGGDIGKAWKVYDKPEPFLFWLQSLPRLVMDPLEPVTHTPAPTFPYPAGDPLAEVKGAIAQALGVKSYGSDGFSSKNVLCPFHDDHNPSASLQREKGLYCHTCGQSFTWKATAEALGIVWPFTTPQPEPITGIKGMSREARRMFISAKLSNLARALDVLLDAGHGGDVMTLDDLQACLSPYFSPDAGRRVFDQLRGKGLPKERGSIWQVFSFLYSLQQLERKETAKYSPHRKTGRPKRKPKVVVRIPTEAEINTGLDVIPRSYYGMSEEVLRDAVNYRAECMASQIDENPGKIARKQLAKPLGISYPTVRAYCDRVGIERTPNPPKMTELPAAEIGKMPIDHRERRTWLLQKKIKGSVFLQDSNGKRYEYTQRAVFEALKAVTPGSKENMKFYRCEYQASDYRRKPKA